MSVQDQVTIQTSDTPGNIAAAWANYFRFAPFGASPVRTEVEINPTIQIDDNSKGPFPVYRPFAGSLNRAAGGATFWAEFEIANADAPESRSVLVIDWIQFVLSG